MIIRIKKRDLASILTLIVFVSLISIISLPVIVYAPTVNTTKIGFKIELVIANRNPQINVSNATNFYIDPLAGNTTKVTIVFNVTDADGAGDINASTSVVNFTLGGRDGQFFTNISASATSDQGTCGNYSDGSTAVFVNCTVILPYFSNSSTLWVVNISVKDRFGGTGINDTLRFIINTLDSVALPYTFVNFSNVTLGQANVRAYPHLLINNTGNDDFKMINISGTALVGTTTTSETVPITSFGVNSTNSSANQYKTFPANGIVTLTESNSGTGGFNLTLTHGSTDAMAPINTKGNVSAFFWVNVPSSGLSSQLYNATWNVTVVANPG